MKRGGPLPRRTALKARTPLRSRQAKPGRTKRPKTRRRAGPTLKALKSRLWGLCRDITRVRHGYQCFTCPAKTDVPHTGHFISSSVCSVELRYDLKNLRPQCYRCNIHLSGNWLAYERRLITEHGAAYVAELKARNEETKGRQYDSLWYLAKIAEYGALLTNHQS